MLGSRSCADLECLLVEWLVERSPYWEIFGGFEGREEEAVEVGFEDLDSEEG